MADSVQNGTERNNHQVDERCEITLVAVDDHPTYVKGLKTLFQAISPDMQIAAVAGTAAEGLRLVQEVRPDLVLMDVRLPDMPGSAAVARLRSIWPSVKVVMLSASDDPSDVHDSIQAGARGYISKRAGTEELINALRAIHTGDVVLAPVAVGSALNGSKAPSLAESEVTMLRLLAEGIGQTEVARRMSVSESTLKRQLTQIQRRMGVDNRMQAIVLAAKRGLI